MGATARSKLRVIIVGITTAISVNVFSIAPNPMVIPPKHPTINKIAAMNPNRLNSISFEIVVSIALLFGVMDKIVPSF